MSDNSKLFDAARDGDEALVSQLIEQGAEVDWKWRDEYNYTALHTAARYGHPPVVTRLLDSGRSLDARSDTGYTPLTWAAEWLPGDSQVSAAPGRSDRQPG